MTSGLRQKLGKCAMPGARDIDVVVELENPDLFNLFGIKQDLEERFHCSVDVVRYREKMNGYLKHRIDQEAFYA